MLIIMKTFSNYCLLSRHKVILYMCKNYYKYVCYQYALHLTLSIKLECDFKYFGYNTVGHGLKHKESSVSLSYSFAPL